MKMMKIAIIGSGYVGTVTGVCLAELGHHIICSDVDEKRIKKLQSGVVPFYEEGVLPLLLTNVEEGRLQFIADNKTAVKDADIIFLCIGTPPLPNGKPDMKPLEHAISEIGPALTGYTLIVEKSTLPIQAIDGLEQKIRALVKTGVEFDMAVVPQFLREGHAVHDFMQPDRIVIGANSQKAINLLVQIHQPLNAPMLLTDMNSAEIIKHASNAFLAMKISFINSIAQICEKTGADILQVSQGLGLDKRINRSYLNAGVGYGGIFFPKDIASLVSIAEEHNLNFDLLKSVDTINRYQRILFVEKIENAFKGGVEGKTIGIWGLAYRPNTDDMRDAPSISIIRSLQKRGAKIKAYDPIAMEATKAALPHLHYCATPYEAAQDVDAIVILTEWPEFETINFNQLKAVTECRLIIDGRNLYSLQRMETLGFNYVTIGRVAASQKRKPLLKKKK
jgi:UDPglucose 6-dehydrogenase